MNPDYQISECKNCGTLLTEATSRKRLPCPVCGETNRIHHETITESLILSDKTQFPISDVIDYVVSQSDPVEFSYKLLKELNKKKDDLKTVRAEHKAVWNIEEDEKNLKIKGFFEKFKPNSIEKIAAYSGIIALVLQLTSGKPEKTTIINHHITQQIQEIYQVNITNNQQNIIVNKNSSK